MKTQIWKHASVVVELTTESPVSHYGTPVMRVHYPAGTADLGPADLCPAAADEAAGTAAALLCAIHAARPLTGATLAHARAFLSQWPEGPQL